MFDWQVPNDFLKYVMKVKMEENIYTGKRR